MATVPSSSPAPPMSTALNRNDLSALIRQVTSPTLYNRQLSSVCQVNGLKSTGVKIELQNRITARELRPAEFETLFCLILLVPCSDGFSPSPSPHPEPSSPPPNQPFPFLLTFHSRTCVTDSFLFRCSIVIQEAYNQQDIPRFYQIKQSITNAMSKQPTPQKPAPGRVRQSPSIPSTSHSYDSHTTTNGYSSHAQNYNGFGQGQGQSQSNGGLFSPSISSSISFKPSPFYSIESQIGTVNSCPIMAQHRSTVLIVLRLNDTPALQLCVDDPNYRVMIFAAAEGSGPQDIAFPQQSELKVNGGDFKANLRGLKNKPGSTRPVDITSALRLKSSYTNNVEFTYALTNKVISPQNKHPLLTYLSCAT